jgi:hypothetical protein
MKSGFERPSLLVRLRPKKEVRYKLSKGKKERSVAEREYQHYRYYLTRSIRISLK